MGELMNWLFDPVIRGLNEEEKKFVELALNNAMHFKIVLGQLRDEMILACINGQIGHADITKTKITGIAFDYYDLSDLIQASNVKHKIDENDVKAVLEFLGHGSISRNVFRSAFASAVKKIRESTSQKKRFVIIDTMYKLIIA